MIETERLRALLDKRGVEWKAPMSFDGTARYDTTAGGYWFHEFNGKITIHGLTPEQAIEATLGREPDDAAMDKLCDGYLYYTSYWCRGCDERFAYRPIGGKDRGTLPKFCPNCGRRIVEPTTNDVDAEATDG